MGIGMGLNLLLLLAMVATNILSLYHLSSTRSPTPSSTTPADVPDHLLHQLHTIRATISHLTRLRSSSSSSSAAASAPPPELLLYSRIAPIASSCSDHPDLLHRYMNYTPFAACPRDDAGAVAEALILRGCHPSPPPLLLPTAPKVLRPPSDPFHAALPTPPSSGRSLPPAAPSPVSLPPSVSIRRSRPPASSPPGPSSTFPSPSSSTSPDPLAPLRSAWA
ncbi:unnamed protein product [Musa acuminata var. zebrina]